MGILRHHGVAESTPTSQNHCMDLKTVEKIPTRELLLSPLYLFHHFTTTLVPGVLAVFLLMMKGSPLVHVAMSATDMMGYKTRVALGLLVAFVIGKVIQAGVLLIAKTVAWIVAKAKATAHETPKVESEEAEGKPAAEGKPKQESESPAQASPEILPPEEKSEEKPTGETKDAALKTPAKLTPEQETNRQFFTALLLGTVLAKDGSAFDKWDSQRANLGLALTSGCVLLLAGFYPGDGLRVYEFAGGLLLVVSGLVQGQALNQIKIEAMGNALGQFIAAHNVEENKEILAAVAPVLPIVMKHINPTASEKEPVQIVTEIAEKSKHKTVPNLSWQQQQHKKKKKH